MNIYVEDTTLTPPKVATFSDYNKFIKYLEEMCIRAHRKTRKERMNDLVSIGYGYDDSNSVIFIRSMQEQFNIGVIKRNRFMRCDVTSANAFQAEEYGD